MFYKNGVLKKFTKFTGKHLCQSLRPATSLKKRPWDRCFPVNCAKLLRRYFLTEHLCRLLLYVGNGDSSSFGEVCETMKKYGNDYLVFKEDCVGRFQKNKGSNLRNYERDVKGKLSNGGTVGGRGRLADAVIDNFQNYYGLAIKNNSISVYEIKKDAIWSSSFITTAFYAKVSHCDNNITSAQKVVLHGVDINVTK